MSDDVALLNRINAVEHWVRAWRYWADWTPVLSQNGVRTKTIEVARYTVIGNTVCLNVQMTCTDAGTAGSAIVISGLPAGLQPKAPYSQVRVIGSGVVLDVSVAYYAASVAAAAADDLRFVGYNVANAIGIAPSFALASGDIIGFQAMYELP